MPSIASLLTATAAAAVVSTASAVHDGDISNTATLTVADLEKYPYARCLDGTGYGYYYRPGVDEDADKWLIMLEGGGLCTGKPTSCRT